MPIGSVNLNYTLNNFEVRKTFDTRINVKTELEFLRFGTKYQSDALGVAYVSSPSIDPDKNILLIDNSNEIRSNAKEAFKEDLFYTDNFIIDYAGFDIADVAKEVNGVLTPLYYWHDLSGVESLINLEILDSNKQPVDPQLWLYAEEQPYEYNPDNGDQDPDDSDNTPPEPSIIGKWKTEWAEGFTLIEFRGDGTYTHYEEGEEEPPYYHNGSESGTYTWDSATGMLTVTVLEDNNGEWGFSHPEGTYYFRPGPNNQTLDLYIDDEYYVTFQKDEVQPFTSFNNQTTIKYARRGVYSNLICQVNKTENSYEIYYVRYKDLATNEVVEKLLDSKLYYEQASYISERHNREYIITEQNSKYLINIVFDSHTYSPTPYSGAQRYWLRRRSFSKINLEKPGLVPTSERWSMKITPGDFYHNGHKYWIPEYYLQLFSPAFPYRFVKENKGVVIGDRLIYLEKHPIANLGISGYYLYIIFKESNGAVKRCFTNDPDIDTYITKQGFVTDIFYEKDGIRSVSDNSGFILMNEDIPQDLEVYVTYRYVERYFNYEVLSVNPSINPDVLGKKLVFYILPDAEEKSVHHLVVDENGIIVDASETPLFISFDGISTNGSASALVDETLPWDDYFTGYELEILSGANSGFKTKITGYDKNSRTLIFNEVLNVPLTEKTTYRILKKIDPYISNGHSYSGWTGYAQANAYFKIGEVHVVQTLSLSDINMLDTRVLGGGIREKEIEAALKLQNEVSWYWDIGNWDGTAYPGMGAILVHLPRYILKEMGGDFEREQVEDIVKRHVASGSYVLIRYYDESTQIENVEPGDKQVRISWNLVNANHYNIYIGSSPDNLTLYSTQPGTRTSTTIINLENDRTYYVQVSPVVGGIERLGSKILGFMPFNYSTTLPPMKYGEGKFIQGSYV